MVCFEFYLTTDSIDKISYDVAHLNQIVEAVYDLGQVWYLIVSIPDLCTLTYLYYKLYV